MAISILVHFLAYPILKRQLPSMSSSLIYTFFYLPFYFLFFEQYIYCIFSPSLSKETLGKQTGHSRFKVRMDTQLI